MDKKEYKKLRQIILKKYKDRTLTKKELGEELLYSTIMYRRANRIAKSGCGRGNISSEEIGGGGVSFRKKPTYVVMSTEEMYYLYKEKKIDKHNDDVIAKYLQLSAYHITKHKKIWIKKGWLKVKGSGIGQKMTFNK